MSSMPAVRPELETEFRAFVEWGAASILIGGDPVLMSQREKLVSLAGSIRYQQSTIDASTLKLVAS